LTSLTGILGVVPHHNVYIGKLILFLSYRFLFQRAQLDITKSIFSTTVGQILSLKNNFALPILDYKSACREKNIFIVGKTIFLR